MIQAINNINFKGSYNYLPKVNKAQEKVDNSIKLDRSIYNSNSVSFMGWKPWYLEETKKGQLVPVAPETKEPVRLTNEELRERIPNDFLAWAYETDFIEKGLKEALRPENLIGEGFEHSAYKIPGNDKYVLRIPRSYYKHTQSIDYSNYKAEDARDMELIGNFGQAVALLTDDDKSDGRKPVIEVLKKQEGFPNANCSPHALFHEDGTYREHVIPYEDVSRKKHFAYSMKTLAEFPDETYDQLIDDLLVSGEAGYKFDHLNSNNFLIDPEAKRINLIDMSRTKKPHKDRFGNTLYALINYEFLGEYTRTSAEYKPENPNEINETIGNMITVCNKFTKAMQKKVQKFNVNSYEFNNFLRDSYSVSTFWLRTTDFEEKLQKLRDMDVLYEGNEL